MTAKHVHYWTGRLDCDSTQQIHLQNVAYGSSRTFVSCLDSVDHSIVDIKSLSYDASFTLLSMTYDNTNIIYYMHLPAIN